MYVVLATKACFAGVGGSHPSQHAVTPSLACLALRFLACPDSVVVVVYHPDSMPEAGEGEAADALCDLAGGAFFDAFMEVRDGKLLPPKPCQAAARIDSEAQAK